MNKHPILGWPPPTFNDDEWHRRLDETLARGLPSAARSFLQDAQRQGSGAHFKTARIAVLRTFSLELSESLLSLALIRWQTSAHFYWFDFGSFEGELLDSGSRLHALHRKQPFDFILLAWRLKDWIMEAWHDPTVASRSAVVQQSLDRIKAILDAASEIAPVICFPLDDHPVDAPLPTGRIIQDALITDHHAYLLEWCAKHSERSAIVELRARTNLDRKAEAFSHQPYSLADQVQVGVAIARACAPWFRASAKVLVLDADDTLWGGIIGEDGIRGVHIGQVFPGNLYWELQLRAKFLKNNGILLALVSKNSETDVAEMFAASPYMPLGWRDFSSRVINWEDKVQNLRQVAGELNLGLNSFVFLDDSPFERAMTRASLPEVRVPDTPDVLAMLDYLENGVDFLIASQSREDRLRAVDYEAQRQREESRTSAPDIETFLRGLNLIADVRRWSQESLPRIAQMLQKTNQFNLTTRRHNLSQLEAWFTDSDSQGWVGWTLSARDRFANQGIVGCFLAHDLQSGEWEIDSFLLSCRALGRGLETALLSYGLRMLKERGAITVIARYLPTGRNRQVQEFYARHGGFLIAENERESVYRFNLLDTSLSVRVPDWIQLEEAA